MNVRTFITRHLCYRINITVYMNICSIEFRLKLYERILTIVSFQENNYYLRKATSILHSLCLLNLYLDLDYNLFNIVNYFTFYYIGFIQ